MYQPRVYRHQISSAGLSTFNVCVRETDLFISAAVDLSREAHRLILEARGAIEEQIRKQPEFLRALKPLSVGADAAPIVREMAEAAARAGVGPMAAVAGAVAEHVGRGLMPLSDTVIVENGGDIFIKSPADRIVGIYAGSSPLSGKIGLRIRGSDTPSGICTSSGTVGHSLSFGTADAVVVLSQRAALADAVATATGNVVQSADDVEKGMKAARRIQGVSGVLIVKGEKVGVWGGIDICRLA